MRTDSGTEDGPDVADLPAFVESLIARFLGDFNSNNLGPGAGEPAWEDFLVGWARGDDPLFDFLKRHIGEFQWYPAEAFALGRPVDYSDPSAEPADLAVISWALCQTEATRRSNRVETRMPSERWARARIFGQMCNRELHLAMVASLQSHGYEAVAPSLLVQWEERRSQKYGRASTWSERHAAHVCGLGTFGLSGGLITPRGQAVRLGSVVVRASVPPTRRKYDNPFAYCLSFAGGVCGACAARCPVGAISGQGRDKEACARQVEESKAHVFREYGFEGYACGLCQTKVPCESGIPRP